MPKTIDMTPKHRATGIPTEHHYFAVSAVGWASDSDMATAIRKRKVDDRGYNQKGCDLFLVPGLDTINYDISFFQPQVEGVQYLGHFNYANFNRTKT